MFFGMLILHNDKKWNINKKKICNTKLHIFDKDAFLSCQKSSSPFYSSVLSVSLPESPSCHPDTKNKVTVLQNLCTVPSVLACRVSSGLLGSWAAPCVGHVRPALPPRTATPSCTWLHKRSNTQHKKAKQQNKNQNITLVVVGIQQKKTTQKQWWKWGEQGNSGSNMSDFFYQKWDPLSKQFFELSVDQKSKS